MNKYERALRRKAVMDDYGITIENVEFDEWLEIVSSDEKLAEWFGEPMQDYIQDQFDAIDLLGSYEKT